MGKYKKLILVSILILLSASILVYQNNPTVKKKNYIKKYNATTLAEKCRGDLLDGEAKSTQSRGCYVTYFEYMMDLKGPKVAVETLMRFAEESRGLNGECHSVGHLLGKYSWKTQKAKSYEGDLTACAFSYGHGILQAASKEVPREELKNKIAGICKFTKDLPGCLHGMGHALRDLSFTNIDSVALCTKEVDNLPEQNKIFYGNKIQTCMEGWAMEDFSLRNGFWVTVSDPKYVISFCDGIEGPGWAGCVGSSFRNYVVAPDPLHDERALERRDERLVWFKKYCLTRKDKDLVNRCMNYVGLTAAEVYTLDMDVKITAPKLEYFCETENKISCYSAFINSRWNRMGNDQEPVKPLCNEIKTVANRELCSRILSEQGQ